MSLTDYLTRREIIEEREEINNIYNKIYYSKKEEETA
jgi:hypothetical protein